MSIGPVVIWLIIAMAMWLRIDHSDMFPVYQNDDSLFYVWAGNSILKDFRHPTSLSIFDTNNYNLFWRSQYRNIVPVDQFGFRLTDPWFDHPFLSSLIIALPAHLLGYTDFSQVPHMVVRIPAYLSSLATLILTYVFAKMTFGRKVATAALLTLAFWPLAVFSSRHSYIENIMTPFWIGSLMWTYKISRAKTYSKKQIVWLVMINFCLAWFKIIGYVAFLISAFWLFVYKKKKSAVIILIAMVLSLLLYLLYGQLIGGNFFWQTIFNQGGRGAYLSSIFYILRSPDVYGILNDGWWYICWIGVFIMISGNENGNRFISLNIMLWMTALFFLVGPSNNSPWYRYPIYPLLAIATGKMLVNWWESGNAAIALLMIMLGLTGYELAQVNVTSTMVRGLIGVVGGGYLSLELIFSAKHSLKFRRCLMIVWAVLAIVGNVWAIRKFPYIACKDHGCVEPQKINVSQPNL